MSQYTSQYPSSVPFPQKFKSFLEEFYRISDTPDAHQTYSEQFEENAELVMASKRGKGRDEILGVRTGMWVKVSSRSHHPVKVFPFGPVEDNANEAEVMLFGTVNYELKEGGRSVVEWGARGTMVDLEGEGVKWRFYQVYLDTGAQGK